MTTLTKDHIHLEGFTNRPLEYRGEGRVHVLGNQFGAYLMVVDSNFCEAVDEWDERHGSRVEFDDPDLADYPGADVAERVCSAMDCGDIRMTDDGAVVWVDHYEWCRSFATVREAGAFWRAL